MVSLDKLGNFTTVDEVKEHDRAGKIHRNLHNPPLKDTVTVPDGGYTIVRFYTHNPGRSLFYLEFMFSSNVFAFTFQLSSLVIRY